MDEVAGVDKIRSMSQGWTDISKLSSSTTPY